MAQVKILNLVHFNKIYLFKVVSSVRGAILKLKYLFNFLKPFVSSYIFHEISVYFLKFIILMAEYTKLS